LWITVARDTRICCWRWRPSLTSTTSTWPLHLEASVHFSSYLYTAQSPQETKSQILYRFCNKWDCICLGLCCCLDSWIMVFAMGCESVTSYHNLSGLVKCFVCVDASHAVCGRASVC
jgi:hypothetical protein